MYTVVGSYGRWLEETTMDDKYLLLIKAQVLRETLNYFKTMPQVDRDYVRYLRDLEIERIKALKTEEELCVYLRDSRRLTLEDWIDSLDWSHCDPVQN